ncbi:MAG TPA: site-specific tyrosine recombinase XerC [Thermoanaerobaculaceae bacterium]|nr:site-specific tyrosine recombinase XerC [Thermoanaerobaculaceae bacterium]HPS79795.1 site-specific tyrosine recombinase XerC [Thermoanaerobaculaceae bacterium]
MPKRGQSRPKVPVGDPTDPYGFPALLARYLEWLAIKNFSPATVVGRAHYLGVFIAWCAERSLTQPRDVTKPVLDRYARTLYHSRKADGQPLSFRSQHSHLVPIRSFFKWLARENLILFNPASELELPRLGHRLPKHVLTAAEADQVLAEPNLSDPLGIRDRAILETFYSTGMRRAELLGLTHYDLDVERGTVMIRQGKGQKDRMVPIGERALAWIDKYLVEVRPSLVLEPDEGTIFLTHEGLPFTPNRLTQLVRDHVDASGIGKRGACHLFRHTMATLMLEGGADIRFIQQMLGHAKLETTQIYTQVSIRQLKAIHSATHPGAKLRRSQAGDGSQEAEAQAPADPHAATHPADDQPEAATAPAAS